MHADQLSLSGGAKLAAELGAATADHLEHTDSEGIAALKVCGSAAGALARLSLCARVESISGGTGDDRRRFGGRAGDGFQSRILAHALDADGAFACVNSHEDVAGGIDYRNHCECGL